MFGVMFLLMFGQNYGGYSLFMAELALQRLRMECRGWYGLLISTSIASMHMTNIFTTSSFSYCFQVMILKQSRGTYCTVRYSPISSWRAWCARSKYISPCSRGRYEVSLMNTFLQSISYTSNSNLPLFYSSPNGSINGSTAFPSGS